MKALLLAGLLAVAGLLSGQLDTIRMASIGGADADGGLAVVELGDGDALVVGYTDSNGWGTRAPWALRLDSMLEVVWQQALPVEAGGVAVGAVVLPDGAAVVASRELLDGANGYGVRWHRLDATTGEVLATATWSSEDWVLPHGVSLQGDTVVTWVTDYSSGTAQPAALMGRWETGEHAFLGQYAWGTEGLTEHMGAGTVAHGKWWIASTERPASDSARVRVRAIDANGTVHWSALAPIDAALVEANALSVVEEKVVVGMTVDEAGPVPMAKVVRWDTSGTATPIVIAPGNPAQVRAVRWNAPEMNYLFRTEVFGLGAGDMIFLRQGPLGGFIGAMTFGWEEAEEPEAMMQDALGAVWLVGSTEHMGANVHVVRAPSDQIGDHTLITSDTLLSTPLSIPASPRPAQLAAFPNPASSAVTLSGLPCPLPEARFTAFALQGTVIATGSADQLDVSRWPVGTYLIDVQCGTARFALRLVHS